MSDEANSFHTLDEDDADIVDPARECDGTFDPSLGRCKFSHHTHCPWCGEIYDCPHFLAGWRQDVGLYEVELLRLYDHTVEDLFEDGWQAKVPADLHQWLGVYETGGHPVDLLVATADPSWRLPDDFMG